jgi:hypothetical protein
MRCTERNSAYDTIRRSPLTDRGLDNAAAEELDALRAEVAALRAALAARQPPRPRRLMEANPEMPGLTALWRGERGLAWRLFVQAAVTVNAALAVIAVVSLSAT